MDWYWTLTDEQWDAFYEAVNEPARDTPKLRALFEAPPFFDQEA